MPTSNDTREPVTAAFTFPVSEVLSGYLTMTAPTRSQLGAEHRRPRGAQTASSDGLAERRAEELWDSLGDFA